MYSWGYSDTSTWKNPGGYKYDSARHAYLDDLSKSAATKGPRAYALADSGPKLDLVDPKGKTITSTSAHPILIGVDGTGSMQTWPAEIFDRMPLLYQTLSGYQQDTEVSFSVIGDASLLGNEPTDRWPLQVCDFGRGPSLDDAIKALYPEGGGGPGHRESYDLWAHYMNTRVQTPNAKRPFLFLMGDELFYEQVRPDQVNRYCGDALTGPLDARAVLRDLAEKYDFWVLRKAYPRMDEKISAAWKDAVGDQRVLQVADPLRVVDVTMGIVAARWQAHGDFYQNLSARQDADGIETVMLSLRAAPELAYDKNPLPSTRKSKGTSRSLEDHP